MLKPCNRLIILILCIIPNAYSNELLEWSGNIYERIHQYTELHAQFSKKICTPGSDHHYYKLLRNYQGRGYYLPEFHDDIDRLAITKNLFHFQKKIKYIESLKKILLTKEKIRPFEEMSNPITDKINELLLIKKKYNSEISSEKRTKLIAESQQELKKLFKLYNDFLDEYVFLKSYNFPNDHLKNRFEYDSYKDRTKDSDIRTANKVFFLRRIVEDGAMDPDHTRSDVYLRTALDTIYLNLQNEKEFISENVRYDLEWVLKNISSHIKRGKETHISRMNEWAERTQEAYDFYKEIVKLKNKEKAKELVKEKNEATISLKDYVYSKQADVYLFWKNQSEFFKALFVLDTILFNEVGGVDGEDGLERADVVNVVLNRMNMPFYRTLEKDQLLWKYLPLPEPDIQKEHWLNVLFKVGEFSFTYHYIGAAVNIFCPDMSRAGKALRAENLKIILKNVKKFTGKFTGVRYFSRVSMKGKIDMSTVWSDYEKIAERPGFETSNSNQLAHYYLNNEYRYLYSFIDPKGLKYQVVEIKDQTYSMTWVRGRPKFFNYRNPHLFTYFSQK